MVKETDLYPPIRAFLQGQGYEVKSEVGAADVVALRGAEEPVIVEMKTRFALALFHQGVARLALADLVYLAVPRGKGRGFAKALKENTALARRLGLGLITVRLRDGLVEVHCDPGPYAPRISKPKRQRLLREFGHCLPAGRAALCGASGRAWPLQGGRGEGRNRGGTCHAADARRSLRLVRAGGKGRLCADAQGGGGVGGL